ncbi:MAG TPA: TIGR03936 family radical SAM-associated protein [Anaerolineaceae bacterium]|nr:TIGR03936 family radical SAM-associated protein [Anaerolineaceae bacterium]HPN50144.1 TIGR03936 family radical SAM-associated protein [Anaerolineaceae bacterium]
MTVYRLRITFAKTAPLRYTSHLDMMHVWERTLRRSGLPIAYSKGFNPGPRIHQGCSLPLGFTSQQEMVDIFLDDVLAIDAVRSALQEAVPPGIELGAIEEIDPKAPALQTQVQSSTYIATLLDPVNPAELKASLQSLLAAPALPRTWREKAYDLRPLIHSLTLLPASSGGQLSFEMHLSAREGAMARPEEVLSAMGFSPHAARVERTKILLA